MKRYRARPSREIVPVATRRASLGRDHPLGINIGERSSSVESKRPGSVRQLHDIHRTGWWVLIGATVIGTLVLIYWACLQGTPGSNRFG